MMHEPVPGELSVSEKDRLIEELRSEVLWLRRRLPGEDVLAWQEEFQFWKDAFLAALSSCPQWYWDKSVDKTMEPAIRMADASVEAWRQKRLSVLKSVMDG